jgi:hypothetical protein
MTSMLHEQDVVFGSLDVSWRNIVFPHQDLPDGQLIGSVVTFQVRDGTKV